MAEKSKYVNVTYNDIFVFLFLIITIRSAISTPILNILANNLAVQFFSTLRYLSKNSSIIRPPSKHLNGSRLKNPISRLITANNDK